MVVRAVCVHGRVNMVVRVVERVHVMIMRHVVSVVQRGVSAGVGVL